MQKPFLDPACQSGTPPKYTTEYHPVLRLWTVNENNTTVAFCLDEAPARFLVHAANAWRWALNFLNAVFAWQPRFTHVWQPEKSRYAILEDGRETGIEIPGQQEALLTCLELNANQRHSPLTLTTGPTQSRDN